MDDDGDDDENAILDAGSCSNNQQQSAKLRERQGTACVSVVSAWVRAWSVTCVHLLAAPLNLK